MTKKQSTVMSNKLSNLRKKIFAFVAVLSIFSSLFIGSVNVYADPDPAGASGSGASGSSSATSGSNCNCKTGILPQSWCCDDGIKNMIQDIADILVALIFVAGTGFIIYSGFIWATAGENPSRVALAKKRILEIVIGLAFFILIDLVIKFLIPD